MSDTRSYRRAVTPIERFLIRSPFSIVTMVVRIQGDVTEDMLRAALDKVRRRHPNLRVRIVQDEKGDPWLTSEGAGEIPVESVPRESGDHWIRVAQQWCQVPFEFDAATAGALHPRRIARRVRADHPVPSHPVRRAVPGLPRAGPDTHLGDSDRPAELLADPAPIGLDNMPPGVAANALVRFVINRMNKKWAAEKVVFDQEDYRALNSAYWTHYPHQVLSVELHEAQTTALVERCRSEEVTVNSALSAAFVGAQVVVQGDKPHHSSVCVAASLRDRLPKPPGRSWAFTPGWSGRNTATTRVAASGTTPGGSTAR